MARLAGVDIPNEKRIEIALTYIFGVGRTRAKETLAATGINPDIRVKDLTDEQLITLRDYLEANYKIEGDLRREIDADIRRKSVPVGQAHIKSTFNNTIISITDPSGAVVSWASGGDVGFKGSRKSTPYAAGMAAESAARKAMEHGVKKVDVFVKGPGSGRETAIRSLQSAGLEVGSITDVTPQAHNGVRPPKRRRV